MVRAGSRRHHDGMMKLLIVDDSELVRVRVADMLRDVPGICGVDTAANLAQALDYLSECPPALMVLDLHLPDGNAMNLLYVFKRLVPDMQIVVLSNDASSFNRTKCREEGVDAFFDKSTEFEGALAWLQQRAAGSLSNSRISQ